MREALRDLLGTDPIPWLLESDEPYARWVTRTHLLSEGEASSGADHAQTLENEGVQTLLSALTGWGEGDYPGHHSPAFLPNRLNLLADMGLQAGDAIEIESLLDELLAHQDKAGRFESFGQAPGRPKPEWGSLLCDTNAITDILLRFGRGDDPRVQTALKRMRTDSSATTQGYGWKCVPEKRTLFRGPGRVSDTCPQVTLEGLRAFSQVDPDLWPEHLLEAARTPLEIWRRRGEERPYAFGHGYQFKSVKWPNFWYDVLWVLETLSRFPQLWSGEGARDEDRESLAELAACLVAYNFDADGRVTPRRTYRAFAEFSFGQKREPSPFATARALIPLVRMIDLAREIGDVDVETIPGSKGGSGIPVPPRPGPRVCPTPTRTLRFTASRAVPRVLARHHVGTPHVPASAESIVADIAAIHSTFPTSPYLALNARLPGFRNDTLDAALYDRRSLVRLRCMRGSVFVVRHDLVLPVLAATRRPVIRHAREFAQRRGVDEQTYERLAPRVLDALSAEPTTTSSLRSMLGDPDGVDVAALVNRMAAESLVLRDRPTGGWRDRQWTYVPFAEALPDIKLDSMDEPMGDVRLLRAYVRAFGPATIRDAAWWSGMGARRVERALDELGDEIVRVILDDADEPSLMHAADVDELAAASLIERPLVALLPVHDPLVMGYARKDRFVPDELRPYVFDRSGNATSTILVDGKVVGVWDVRTDPEPEIVLFTPGLDDAESHNAVTSAARELLTALAGKEASVVTTDEMLPLASRPAGFFAHPLRASQRCADATA